MENIILFDTTCGTRNIGDEIINLYIKKELDSLLRDNFVIGLPTHTPIVSDVQKLSTAIGKNRWKALYDTRYKFLCGTNLIKKSLLKINKDWMIGLTDIGIYKGAIAVGCGMQLNSKRTDLYTEYIYKHIFNDKYIHSVRDQETKSFFEKLGFKAVNTGCPTLWSLTPEKCERINTLKQDAVVFTLTDYKRDSNADAEMIRIIKRNYKKVFFWPQGHCDFEYFQSIDVDKNDITIVKPNLNAYEDVLNSNVDYVGTRLHGGIFAMHHGCRSIIIAIDNRTREMDSSFKLNALERKDISQLLEDRINSKWDTRIKVNSHEIDRWKSQFL